MFRYLVDNGRSVVFRGGRVRLAVSKKLEDRALSFGDDAGEVLSSSSVISLPPSAPLAGCRRVYITPIGPCGVPAANVADGGTLECGREHSGRGPLVGLTTSPPPNFPPREAEPAWGLAGLARLPIWAVLGLPSPLPLAPQPW